MKQYIFLLLIIILTVIISIFYNPPKLFEGYNNYTLDKTNGNYPESQNNVLVQDIYPAIGKNEITNNTSNNVWWHYPIFELGSYKQITNNIRYPNNPDEGTCMPVSMCGALYKDKDTGNNFTKPLPPVNPNVGIRVGYFNANDQLIDNLPFRTDTQNILY